MLVTIKSAILKGREFTPVNVETTITSGIGIHLVGLADVKTKESLFRTVTALQSLGYSVPGKKIVINVIPSDLYKKFGSGLDLAIALGIIYASEQAPMPESIANTLVCGELGLDGSIRPVAGGLILAEHALAEGKSVVMPHGMALEAVPFGGEHKYSISVAENLKDALSILEGARPGDKYDFYNVCEGDFNDFCKRMETKAPLSYFEGLPEAEQRAVMIAAAGGFDVTVVGEKDDESCGRRIARAFRELLPTRNGADVIETAKNYSAMGRAYDAATQGVPFRDINPYASPMDTVNEVMLAHGGVLLAEDILSTPKRVREVLIVNHHPAQSALVMSMHKDGQVAPDVRDAVLKSVQIFSHAGMLPGSMTLAEARDKVLSARGAGAEVSRLTPVQACEAVGEDNLDTIGQFAWRLGISAQCTSPIARIALAIARLDGSKEVSNVHVAEACSYKFICKA